ncbi:MAG: NCS2 family permease [Marinifilaceae bacterium]
MLEKLFKLSVHKTDVRREMIAGFTTFMAMAYILAVNPDILSVAGMDKGAVFTATALSAMVGCFLMGIMGNLPIGLAPGMGLNAFFAFTVVLGMGYSYQFALAGVFIEGLLFIVMSLFNIRESIIKAIPSNVKISISVGIGLFITVIGLKSAGIVVASPATLVTLGDLTDPSVLLGFFGILVSGILLVRKVPGALLISILITTLVGIPMGVTKIPEGFSPVSMAPSLVNNFTDFDWSQIWSMDMLVVVITFMFIDIFDTVGTLIGVCTSAKLLDKNGEVPNVKRALLADAIATTFGAVLGTSTVTSYVESASGVSAGGRTGLTAWFVGLLFLCSLFFAPMFLIIPGAATCCALVMVGLFMLRVVGTIEFEDFSDAIPAFITIVFIPFSYSIADGIVLGILSYVFINAICGKFKKLSPTMIVLALLFVAKIIWM